MNKHIDRAELIRLRGPVVPASWTRRWLDQVAELKEHYQPKTGWLSERAVRAREPRLATVASVRPIDRAA